MTAQEVDAGTDKNKENVYSLLEEVFESCLQEADLTDSIDTLTQLYESFSSQGFESSFEDILMLVVAESRRSSDVQKIFRFISDFTISLDNKYREEIFKNKETNKEDEDEEIFVHPFLKYLFETLLNWSSASSFTIRFRSCQLLYMVLTNVLDSGAGEIDFNIYEKIAGLIETRSKDISANVRAHSVLLAKFFQDPSDHNDPVIDALCWQLETDLNPRVRQNILEIIAACEETIIPVTTRLLLDKNSLVRNSALQHICQRISPLSYSPEYKILILNQCFQDASAIVRGNAAKKLIPVWFRSYGDKLCIFFKNLRIGNDSLDKLPFIKPLIYQLFKLVRISQILEEIDLDPETALPRSLNGEKIFVWHNFYLMAYQQEKLKKFIPQSEALIEFISKHFKESMFDDAYTYNELISFAMDVMDILEDKCEDVPSNAIDLLKNLLIPQDVIPYAVTMYCEYATKETKEIHNDLLQTINELMEFVKVSAGEEEKKILLKCLDIYSETLAQDNISPSVEVMTIKDELVLPILDSDDVDIQRGAFRALSLYCLLDIEEARQFWPFIEKTVYDCSNDLKLDVLKSSLDILRCHGCRIFGESSDETSDEFDNVLEKLLLHAVDSEIDMKVVFQGMTKLYLSHQTYSPIILAKLILLMFDLEEGHIIKNSIADFLELYGESSEEAECLSRSFLTIINMLFSGDHSNPYHKVNIKTVALQLLEFAKLYEDNKNFEVQKRFRDVLVLKLTNKFIKRPWRLPALDLEDICSQIMPKDVDILVKLKKNVKIILDSFGSAIFQKNPFSKKSMNFFTSYLKKIQAALNTAPDEENNQSQRLDSTPESNFLSSIPLEPVTSPLEQKEISF